MIDDGGHFIPHDSADKFNALLSEFLTDLPKPTDLAERKKLNAFSP